MKVLPNLNLNKHPRDCVDGGLIHAENVIVSQDNSVIQTEPILQYSRIDHELREIYNKYTIKYILTCNKEIVIFVKPKNEEDVHIIRYDETTNTMQQVAFIEYSGGEFVGTFTYNKNDLIIAFSEYDEYNELNVPLRTLNLGEYRQEIADDNKNQLNNKNLHPVVPKIKIPNVDYSITNGNSYKGWYFVFVRYKIGRSTYTKWYNTNCSFLLDYSETTNIIKYVYLKENTKATKTVYLDDEISNNENYVPISFKLDIKDLDVNYNKYQVCFVIVNKNNTIVKQSYDLNIDTNNYKYNNSSLYDISLEEVLTDYNNYYNIKSIITKQNVLYIGNYKELDENISKSLSDINVNIDFDYYYVKTINTQTSGGNSGGETGGDSNIEEIGYAYWKNVNTNKESEKIPLYLVNNKRVIRGTQLFVHDFVSNTEHDHFEYCFNYTYDTMSVQYYNKDDLLTISYRTSDGNGANVVIRAGDLFIDLATLTPGFATENTDYPYSIGGVFYRLENGELIDIFPDIDDKINSAYQAYMDWPNKWDYQNDPYDINSDLGTGGTKWMYIPIIAITKVNNNRYTQNNGNQFVYKCIERLPNHGQHWNVGSFGINVVFYKNNTRSIANDIITTNAKAVDKYKYEAVSNIKFPQIYPDQFYNFFIHFVDEYGNGTKGYNLSYFNTSVGNNIFTETNNIGNYLIRAKSGSADGGLLEGNVYINNIPNPYVGYFLSYEATERTYKDIYYWEAYSKTENTNKIKIYNDNVTNIEDVIDYDFDAVSIYFSIKISEDKNYEYSRYINNNIDITDTNNKADYKVIHKEYFPADTYNNILHSSYILLTLENIDGTTASITKETRGVCVPYKTSIKELYIKENKQLIPCSQVCYDINKTISFNTNNAFNSKAECLLFDDVFFNDATLNYKHQSDTVPVDKICYKFIIPWATRTPYEYRSIRNEPVVVAFPVAGLETTDIHEKAYIYGRIVKIKNTNDLFENKHFNFEDAHPKTLDWYNPNIINNYNFPKTLRRSNIIQDESDRNRWREFPIESYKNITENKGSIVKIIAIGTFLLVHTQYSLFMFNGSDSIKSQNSEDNNNNNIQLASIDIWDINYKEILTSTLGRAGLAKQEHSIVGDFGYIWWDAESRRIYKFDNNSISYIDDNVRNFINKLKYYDLNIVEDINRNRLLFNFYKGDVSYVLSYNYVINSFVSLHSYEYSIGYNTKNNIYLVTKDNRIKDFYDNYIGDGSMNPEIIEYNDASISIICNANFEIMKSINAISYNVRKVVKKVINDFLPVEDINPYYPGDTIRIYNDLFDTGVLDIYTTELNVNEDHTKPYWRMGNWNFNNIRNSIDNSLKNSKDSRIYGNYFIIQFGFKKYQQVEIESINVKTSNSNLI